MKFNTRAFMIRYCEEEVQLNDICNFRFEIDTDQEFNESMTKANYLGEAA